MKRTTTSANASAKPRTRKRVPKPASVISMTRSSDRALSEAERVTGLPDPPLDLRAALVDTVRNNALEILAAVVKEAKKGGYLPAKYLFEFAGLAEPQPEPDPSGSSPALVELLFAALDDPEMAASADIVPLRVS